MATKALKAKEKGNAAFKAEKYPEAVGHYTEAILADSTEPTYPLNRAAAYLKLGKAIDAERDCSAVLRLSPGHVKALFRRAQARVELGKLNEAKSDLVDALKREPGNLAVKYDTRKVDRLLSERQDSKSSPINVTSVPPPPVPQRRRVPIELVEEDSLTPSSPVQSRDALTPISSRSLQPKPVEALPTPLPSARELAPKSSETTGPAPQMSVRPSSTKGGIFRASGQHTIFRTLETSQPQPVAKRSTVPKVSKAKLEDLPIPAPMSFFDFMRMWDLATPTERWDLLCQIPPRALPSLFKTSLEAPLFFQLLEVCSFVVNSTDDPSIKSGVRDYLRWFQRVPRFSTVALFLNKQERQLVNALTSAVDADDWKV